jgi:hypothetical protein
MTKRFEYIDEEDYPVTRFGSIMFDILKHLKLPTPMIKGCILKKFKREGLWGIRVVQQGREGEAPIEYRVMGVSMERGIDIIMQHVIACLCGRYSNELEGHYSFPFGRRDDEGSPFCYGTENMGKDEFVSDYFQGLELLVHDLYFDTSEELHKNDELCAQVQVNDEKIKEQEEKTKELEEKFKAQEKKFISQEKRVKQRNKQIRDLKEELSTNDVELEADCDLIKRLRAEKKELQERNAELEKEVKDLRSVLIQEGFEIQEFEEEVDEGTMIED